MSQGPTIPEEMFSKLHSQILSDPELPRFKPTSSFWQLPPHPTLENIQSPELRGTVDYAIIGSGITGCSIAKHILDHPTSTTSTVTVFEARTITSGASGRNGGVLASFVPYAFSGYVESFGKKLASEVARFAHNTLEKMHELGNVNEELKEAGEVRRCRNVTGFLDMEVLEYMKQGFALLDELVPETNLDLEVIGAEEALKKYNMKNVAGALSFKCGAFWPYRFVTTMWSQLYAQYKDTRLAIETHTPVTSITYESTNSTHPYTLHTPRGLVQAKKVVHATNAYAGHLLPEIRGKIFPIRYTMSTQKPQLSFGRHGNELTWSWFADGSFDPATGVYGGGTYYACQNGKTGDLFLGGERTPADTLFTADDTTVTDMATAEVTKFMPQHFEKGFIREGRKLEGESEMLSVWTGIEGYTPDHFPLVGRIPDSLTGRASSNGEEWICAGFNGAGGSQCWTAGEAMVKIMMGESVEGSLPSVYLMSEERIAKSSSEDAVRGIILGEWKV